MKHEKSKRVYMQVRQAYSSTYIAYFGSTSTAHFITAFSFIKSNYTINNSINDKSIQIIERVYLVLHLGHSRTLAWVIASSTVNLTSVCPKPRKMNIEKYEGTRNIE